MTTENHRFNPFPGLRAFEWDEAHLFFGREGQSDELLRRLSRVRLLAVVGTSGSGKSSLVRAGLLPALAGGFMARAGASWRIALFRPGDAPIDALAAALISPGVLSDDTLEPAVQRAIAGTVLRRSPLGLVEIVRQARLAPGENLLLVVDQFEEVFRFRGAAGDASTRDESAAFVKLILEATRQAELPIYVVLTMRSDFLGECAQFRDLPEALNDGQYLVPRMTRDERRAAITGPVAVGHGAISPRLVQRLLNDVGDDPDQLPILQHALMRTWDHWERHGAGGRAIDFEDYEAIGGMAEALSRHADEAYSELPDDGRRLAERIFKALTTRGPNALAVRRPMSLARLADVVGAPVSQVAAVIEQFRAPGRSLLMPPPPTPLEPSVVIDISHESLIRQWGRLRVWLDEEIDSRAMYLRIVDSAQRRPAGKSGLWRDPDLASALDWKRTNEPNAAWASLYDPSFEPAMRFLDDSRTALAAERRQRRIISGAAGLGLIALVAVLIGLGVVWLSRRASEAERREADVQRVKAVQAATVAEAARAKAEEERKRAESERQRAETERQKVEEALKRAEAERQRAESERQRAEAEQQKADAERKRAQALVEETKRQTVRADEASEAVGVARKVIGDLAIDLRPSVAKLGVGGTPPQFFGTAFLVSTSGLLVSAGHVVDQLRDGVGQLEHAGGGRDPVKVVRIDKSRDLALLSALMTSGAQQRCLRLSDTPVKIGTSVIALGMAGTQGWYPTSGTVTGLSTSLKNVPGTSGETGDLITVAMKIEGGFSGAPVVDVVTQRVIGIVAYGQDEKRTYLIPATRIRAAFAGELSGSPCPTAK